MFCWSILPLKCIITIVLFLACNSDYHSSPLVFSLLSLRYPIFSFFHSWYGLCVLVTPLTFPLILKTCLLQGLMDTQIWMLPASTLQARDGLSGEAVDSDNISVWEREASPALALRPYSSFSLPGSLVPFGLLLLLWNSEQLIYRMPSTLTHPLKLSSAVNTFKKSLGFTSLPQSGWIKWPYSAARIYGLISTACIML